MLKFVVGDIFRLQADMLVNPVNTVGVMGAGLAAQFSERYPEMFENYKLLCKHGQVRVGEPFLWKRTLPWILNVATKTHWKYKSELSYVHAACLSIASVVNQFNLNSVGLPWLGCGEGGLSKDEVRVLFTEVLQPMACEFYIVTWNKEKLP